MNQCNFIGRLTKDIDVNYTQNGKAYTRFSLAVNKFGKKDEADFFNCIAWDKLAEIMAQYLKKGRKIQVTCTAGNNNYEKDGQKFYGIDFTVRNLEMIDYGNSNNSETNEVSNEQNYLESDEEDYPF